MIHRWHSSSHASMSTIVFKMVCENPFATLQGKDIRSTLEHGMREISMVCKPKKTKIIISWWYLFSAVLIYIKLCTNTFHMSTSSCRVQVHFSVHLFPLDAGVIAVEQLQCFLQFSQCVFAQSDPCFDWDLSHDLGTSSHLPRWSSWLADHAHGTLP